MAHKSGLSTQADVVAELGPGDSLGVGLAALLSGASQYFALDVKEHASDHRNVEVFDELANLFARQDNIPDEIEFPNVKPYLESYEFPDHVLTQSRLQQTLDEGRIASIRDSLSRLGSDRQPNSHIAYVSDWDDSSVIEQSSIDMVVSQAVLEHFDFRILCDLKVKSQSSVARSRLAPRFNHLSDDDLTTSGAFIQAVCRKS